MKKYLEKLKALFLCVDFSNERWKRARSVIAFLLVFATTYSLILPAITLDLNHALNMAGINLIDQSRGDLCCHFVVHKHTDDCYTEQPVYDADGNQTGREKVLSCGKADWAVHKHDNNCYQDGQLVCQLPEYEEHVHDAGCYETQKVLTCEKEETTGHKHTDACYETHVNNVCDMEEHEYDEECYEADPDTGVQVLVCDRQEHVHSDECYETEKELICGQEECKPHKHTKACYKEEKVLICEKLELHTYTLDCYEKGPNGESPVEMGWVSFVTDENDNEILSGDPAHLVCGKVELLKHQHDASCFLTADNNGESNGTENDASAKENGNDAAKNVNNNTAADGNASAADENGAAANESANTEDNGAAADENAAENDHPAE